MNDLTDSERRLVPFNSAALQAASEQAVRANKQRRAAYTGVSCLAALADGTMVAVPAGKDAKDA